jgi:hypothetical protein
MRRRSCRPGFDFTSTEAQREQKVREVLAAIEEQRVGLHEVSDASSALRLSVNGFAHKDKSATWRC